MKVKFCIGKSLQKYFIFGIVPKLFLAPVAFLLIASAVAIRPFLLIQFVKVDWQFGHMLAITHASELNNSKRNKTHKRKRVLIYCLIGTISNKYVLQKLRENIVIFHGHLAWLLIYFCRKVTGTLFEDPNLASIQYYENQEPLIKFNEIEKSNGKNFLSHESENFVCLNVRCSAYNESMNQKHGLNLKPWVSRNSDIKTYVNAIEKLTIMGYQVYRMGQVVQERIPELNSRVHDYANNGSRTEFLDIYLGAFCKFAVSTMSGWDDVIVIFKRPLLAVNVYDFLNISNLSRQCLIFPKLLFRNDQLILLDEIIDMWSSGYFNERHVNLSTLGVGIRDLTSEELVEAVTEMAQRVEGTFVETPEQKEMQAKLKHILSTHPKLQPSPNYYPIRAQFASCFLSRYPNFLDGLD